MKRLAIDQKHKRQQEGCDYRRYIEPKEEMKREREL